MDLSYILGCLLSHLFCMLGFLVCLLFILVCLFLCCFLSPLLCFLLVLLIFLVNFSHQLLLLFFLVLFLFQQRYALCTCLAPELLLPTEMPSLLVISDKGVDCRERVLDFEVDELEVLTVLEG